MTINKPWSILLFLALALAGGRALAQTWQPAASGDDRRDSQEWEQGGARQPEPQQWRAVHREECDEGAPAPSGQAGSAAPGQSRSAKTPDRTVHHQAGGTVAGDQTFVRQAAAESQDVEGRPGAVESIPVDVSNSGRRAAGWADGEEIIEAPPGGQRFEPLSSGGELGGSPGCGQCGSRGCGDCGCGCAESDGCGGQPCGKRRGDGCDFGYELFDGTCGSWIRNFTFFAGADAFKGPLDRGTNGDYGFNEGLNYAGPLGDPWGCGFQIGANAVQSNLSGAPVVTFDGQPFLQAADRTQTFVTAAVFRRELCNGYQWGVAYDYLHDNYYTNTNLQQIRTESSIVFDGLWELGYYGAYGISTDQVTGLSPGSLLKINPTDMFCLFVRKNFENGGDGRLWGGATGDGDGLIGVDLWVPLGKGWALQNEVNYLIPKQGAGATAQTNESWGFLVQLVWYPGQLATCQHKNLYRPIFNVADNSLFMVDRLAHP
jgi:hypothetical protein